MNLSGRSAAATEEASEILAAYMRSEGATSGDIDARLWSLLYDPVGRAVRGTTLEALVRLQDEIWHALGDESPHAPGVAQVIALRTAQEFTRKLAEGR